MPKVPKQRFILNLKLNTEIYEEHILDKRFNIGRMIYNSILSMALKRYNEMVKTKRWRENQEKIKEIYKKYKNDIDMIKRLCLPYFKIRKSMLEEFRLSEYSLHENVAPMQKRFKNNIDSFTAQKIASRVWVAINDILFGEGTEVHFKGRNNPLNSIEGKSNNTGIRYKMDSNTLEWLGLKIKVQQKFNEYEINALRSKICYCRIKRRFVRKKYKYILQLVLGGIPPTKVNKRTGEIKNSIGSGTVGIDIGTQTVAYAGDLDIKLLELAPSVQSIENEKRRILRYMDRSKRAGNPNNFNEDGTIKKGKLEWNFSKRYIKARNKLKNIYRKQSDIRRLNHNLMANELLKNGDTFLVETMNFKGLQRRAKETKKDDNGKFKRKKRFGKSLANKAPSMFLTILSNKLKSKDGSFLEVNTKEVKASQYNHLNKKYSRKKLCQRWNYFEYNNKSIKVQRDIYSAYLIKNVNENLSSINNDKCVEDFDSFLKLHDIEIKRLLSLDKTPSSMGV